MFGEESTPVTRRRSSEVGKRSLEPGVTQITPYGKWSSMRAAWQTERQPLRTSWKRSPSPASRMILIRRIARAGSPGRCDGNRSRRQNIGEDPKELLEAGTDRTRQDTIGRSRPQSM
jgi:hypothetical protein